MVDLTLAPLDELAGHLEALSSVRKASTDPADLTVLPGVFVRFTGFADRTFGGDYDTTTGELVVVVDSADPKRARAQLLAVAGDVVDALDAVSIIAGDIRPQPTILPDSQTVLPGLVIPITL